MLTLDTHTDEELLPLLNGGSQAAFGVLYTRYFRKLYHYVRATVHDTRLSEDIVQELFFDLWQRHKTLEPHTLLASYLYRAARNKVVDHLRAEATRKNYAHEFTTFASTYNNNVDDQLALNDLNAIIEKSISELPPRMQMAFRMSRFEHVPIAEIAQRMNISTRTVEDYLTKTLAHLRISLGEMLVLVWWLVE